MNIYKKKIDERSLTSKDVDEIIFKIETILKEKQEGYTELSKDDIKDLRICGVLSKKYDENKTKIIFSTRNDHLSSHKTRKIVDELALNQIITDPIKGIGGQIYFEILDRIRFRNFIFQLIDLIIGKIPSKVLFEELRSFNWHNPYVSGIIIGLTVLFLWSVLTYLWPDNSIDETPRVEIESISFSPTTFRCNEYYDFNLKYKVAHIGGREVGFGQPYYIFINQTKNSCLYNFTFFNNSQPQSLCYNTFYRGNMQAEVCYPKFDPIYRETIQVESNLNNLQKRMVDLFKDENVSSCQVSEQVKICVNLDNFGYCSDVRNVNLEYIGCEKQN